MGQIILCLLIPETPFFHVLKDRPESAERSLRRIRGKDFDAIAEVSRLEKALDEAKALGTVGPLQVVAESVYRKPLLLLLALQFFVQFTGLNGISLYMTEIFIKAGFEEDKSLYYSAAVASAQVL